MTVQYAGEAALWEVVAAFSEAESAAQTLLIRPDINLDPETVSMSQSRLRGIVENRCLAGKQ